MTKLNSLLIVFLLILSVVANASVFHFNSLGYLPDQPKIASVSKEFSSFQLINADNNEVVFEGKASASMYQKDVDVTVWLADFSSVKTTGNFFLKLDCGDVSPVFSVGETVYNDAFKTSMRAFYLWRCGAAVSGDHNGVHYEHPVCHMEDGYLDYIGDAGKQKDGTGGWHDAGDHGKYVVNAGITVGLMFFAWEHFQNKLENFDLELPETAAGFPQFLEEVKWETDWLLKMQYPDGSGKVSHKLTRKGFSGFIMPEDDHENRYFTVWSSAATADFVAMMAQAARYFKPYDAAYAEKCLDAAKLSYQTLIDNPEREAFKQGDFSTGGYQTNDTDDRLWAAAEMWETTGDKTYLADVEARLNALETKVEINWDWGSVANMGVYTYLFSERKGRNKKLVKELKTAAIASADSIVGKAQADIFNRPLGDVFYWGCNGTVARQVLNLQVANMLKPNKKYTETSLDAIAHLFGRNLYARSFVTGLGMNPPMNPHCRRSGADGIKEPWPGYVVGGGRSAANWKDEEGDYTTNEIAINWQAALVYALAAFVE